MRPHFGGKKNGFRKKSVSDHFGSGICHLGPSQLILPAAAKGGASPALSKIIPTPPKCAKILINKYKLVFPRYSLSPLLAPHVLYCWGVWGIL